MTRRVAAELGLVVNTVVWGSTFVLVKSTLLHISPLLFLALRFSLATAALALIYRKAWTPGALAILSPAFFKSSQPAGDKIATAPKDSPQAPGAGKALAAGALTGVFLFLGYLFQTWGLRLTSPPKSAFITGLTSVMVPLLASFVYRNKPRIFEWVGVLVATVGLALMTLGPVGNLVASVNGGDWLTLCCAFAFAAHIVTLAHFARRMSFELISIAQVGAAAALSLGLFGWVETAHVEWQPSVVYAILITGLLATALAFTIQAWAQKHTTSTRTALIYMLEPVVAWLTSYLLAGEGLTPRASAGAALILGGVMLVELKPLNGRQHPSS